MMNEDNRRPVALEDILRLKRAERPSAEFWTQFDRELRAKQLAALVEKRPWWRVVPRAFAGLSRYHLPLGATAVLAISIISVREFRSGPSVNVQTRANSSVPAVVAVIGLDSGAVSDRTENPAVAPDAVVGVAEDSPQFQATNQALEVDTSNSTRGGGEFTAHLVALGAEPTSMAGIRLIGDTLISAQEVALVRDAVGSSRGFESRVMPTRTTKVDPLAQMTSPVLARSNWMLNATLTSASAAPAVRRGDRIASRLTSDRIYDDTVSRIDAHGNSFGLRF